MNKATFFAVFLKYKPTYFANFAPCFKRYILFISFI